MKIGVSSYSFSHFMRETGADYFKICDIAKETGFDGIEFTDLQGEDELALAKEIRAYCEKIGLEITAYTIGADFIEHENELERLKRKVDVAEALGAKLMRHDVTWTQQPMEWTEIIERVAPSVRALTEYAATKGIRTCTENHGRVMQDANRIEKLIQTVDNPNYGWLVDMGNFLCADEPPMHALPIAAKYAFHAHAKDFIFKSADEVPCSGWIATRNGDFIRGTIVGHGVVPIKKCVQTLRNAGYDGYLSLEFEGLEDNMTAIKLGYEFLKQFRG